MFSSNNDSLNFSCLIWMSLISFLCICSWWDVWTLLNKSGESGLPCLLLQFRNKASPFLFQYHVNLCHVMYSLYYGEIYTSDTQFGQSFYEAMLKSAKCHFCIYWQKYFLPFILLIQCYIIDLQILNHPCIPVMSSTLSWWMIFLMY